MKSVRFTKIEQLYSRQGLGTGAIAAIVGKYNVGLDNTLLYLLYFHFSPHPRKITVLPLSLCSTYCILYYYCSGAVGGACSMSLADIHHFVLLVPQQM